VTLAERADGLFCAAPERLPKAALLQVVDGDTAEILWEDKPTFLRYYGVNTPERGHPCYETATARNRVLSGAAVRLAFEERERDRYGRLLAYVFTEDGRSVDAQLVAEGFGKAWRRDGRFRDRLAALEDGARKTRTGCLWSDEAPSSKSKSRRKPNETLR
jgi:micrococcal nuclease